MECLYLIRYMISGDINFLIIKINESSIESNIKYTIEQLLMCEIDIIDKKLITRDNINDIINNELTYRELSIGLEKFIYFDDYYRKWMVINSETNYDILNYLDNKSLRIYLIGDNFLDYTKHEEKRLFISEYIEKSFFIENKSILFFNTINKNNKIDINLLYDYSNMFLSSKEKYCAFIFSDNIDLSTIINFFNKIRKNKNVKLFILINNELNEISKDSVRNQIILRKI